MNTPDPATLPVPDAALAEFARTQGLPDPRYVMGTGGVDWDIVATDVRAIASPIVAAELRARAHHLAWEADRVSEHDAEVLREIERDLRRRANELDPPR